MEQLAPTNRQARKLAGMFAENFRAYSEGVGDDVRAAGRSAPDALPGMIVLTWKGPDRWP